MDLGTKQEEVWRLTDAASTAGVPPEDFVPKVQECADEHCITYHRQPDEYDCQTSLAHGFRHLYCTVRSVINIKRAQGIAGIPIFLPGGPHLEELSLKSDATFGHYNPEFLDWLDRYIIPVDEDERFLQLKRIAYDAYIGEVVRALYFTHKILFASQDDFEVFKQDYLRVRNEVAAAGNAHSSIGGMQRDVESFASIKQEYQTLIAAKGKLPGLYFENKFFPISNYLKATVASNWYMANTAGGFWVRRSIDGTEAKIFDLVIKTLEHFEPDVLNDDLLGRPLVE